MQFENVVSALLIIGKGGGRGRFCAFLAESLKAGIWHFLFFLIIEVIIELLVFFFEASMRITQLHRHRIICLLLMKHNFFSVKALYTDLLIMDTGHAAKKL